MTRLVMLRHGESYANAAGQWLCEGGFEFGAAFSSVLQRATHTRWHVLDALEQTWIASQSTWRLNERHYGALQGMTRNDASAKYGAAQVRAWRRDYDETPPAQPAAEFRVCCADRRYDPSTVPRAESLRDLETRLAPFWTHMLLPELRRGADVLVVAHGNSLRALRRLIDGHPHGSVPEEDIPTGVPIVCTFEPAAQRPRPWSLRNGTAASLLV